MSTKPQMSHQDWLYLKRLLEVEDGLDQDSVHLDQLVPDGVMRFVNFMVDDTYDGAPYCSHCGPKSACDCGPIASNE